MAVPGRNRTIFCRVFRSHYCVQTAVAQYFSYGWGSYVLCKLMNTWHVYTAHMSPTLNASSALLCFEHSNAIEIHNAIMFDFYPGLPHICSRKTNKMVEKRWKKWPFLLLVLSLVLSLSVSTASAEAVDHAAPVVVQSPVVLAVCIPSGADSSGPTVRGRRFRADGSKTNWTIKLGSSLQAAKWHESFTSLPNNCLWPKQHESWATNYRPA